MDVPGVSQLTSKHRITTDYIGRWNIFILRSIGFLRP